MPAVALLALEAVTKRYPGVTALDAVDLTVEAGMVHAVVGENGAGKSTLLKIIAGALRPDSGRILWDGAPVHFAVPRDALRRGITVIYQELALVPGLGATANIFLGMERTRGGVLNDDAMTETATRGWSRSTSRRRRSRRMRWRTSRRRWSGSPPRGSPSSSCPTGSRKSGDWPGRSRCCATGAACGPAELRKWTRPA